MIPAAGTRRPVLDCFPPVVEFCNVEAGFTYEMVLLIKNIDAISSHRVRFSSPSNPAFSVHPDPAIVRPPHEPMLLAYGLERKAIVRFSSDSVSAESKSDLEVLIDGQPSVMLSLFAYAPRPEMTLQMGDCLDLGVVVMNSSTTRSVTISNSGRSVGSFEVVEASPGLSCLPSKGIVQPQSSESVNVRLQVKELGHFKGHLKFQLGGEIRPFNVIARVVKQSLELLTPDGDKVLESIDFGTMYLGRERTYTAFLTNTGPQPSSFSSSVEDVEQEEESDAEVTPSKIVPFLSVVSVNPTEGVVEPFSQLPITLKCRPIVCQDFPMPSVPILQRVVFGVVETGQSVQVAVSGKVVKPGLEVYYNGDPLTTKILFGDVCLGQQKKRVVTVKNTNDILALEFSFAHIANFRITPRSGVFKPLQSLEVTILFTPKQLGRCSMIAELSICGGVYNFPLRLVGVGVSAPSKSQLKESSREGHFKSLYHRPQVEEGGRVFFSQRVEYSSESFNQSWKINNSKYVEWLRKQQSKRASKKDGDGLTLEDTPGDNDFMPKLIFRATMQGADSQQMTMMKAFTAESSVVKQQLEAQALQNTFVKKKFKTKPSTQNELRECKAVLSRAELFQNVTAGNKKIDLGKVPVNTRVVEPFNVANTLPQNIFVTVVNNHDLPELAVVPEAAVVPPMSIGSFDICFQSAHAQNFNNTLQYTINGSHSYAITLTAEAIPVQLTVSSDHVDMLFQPLLCRAYMSETITLFNPFTEPAKYKAATALPFAVEPSEGRVAANGHSEVELRCFPDNRNVCDGTVVFFVENGVDMNVSCHAEVATVSIVANRKNVDFGRVPVGLVKQSSFKLRNTCSHDAYFLWEPSNKTSLPDVSLVPEDGCIPSESTLEVLVTLKPSVPQTYEAYIRMLVPGGKNLRLFLRGRADFPSVSIEQDEFDFGEICVGGAAALPVSVSNTGTIPAVLLMDLQSRQPEFSIRLPEMEDIVEMQHGLQLCDGDGKAGDTSPREKGRGLGRWQLSLKPGGKLSFDLVFYPRTVSSHSFELPLRISGQSSQNRLHRLITASAIQPPISLSHRSIDFGTKVVLKSCESIAQYYLNVLLRNESPRMVCWNLDLSDEHISSGIFRVTPAQGELQPGHKCSVQIAFAPVTTGTFHSIVSVNITAGGAGMSVQLEIQGSASFPRMEFDVSEVVLPTVPLGVKSSTTFHILNIGYENLEVVSRLSPDKQHVPLSLSFPKGTRISTNNSTLPVEVSMISSKPCSFVSWIEFFDVDNNSFRVPVSGVVENSLFGLRPFFSTLPNRFEVVRKKGKTPLVVEKETKDRQRPNGFDKLTAISALQTVIVESFSEVKQDLLERVVEVFSPRAVEGFRNWLNANVLKIPIKAFPSDLIKSNGTALLTLIETLSGKRPATASDFIVTASAERGDRSRPMARDRAQRLVQGYGAVLGFLQEHGALMAHVRPEYLLDIDDYLWHKFPKQGENGLSIKQLEILESLWPKVSVEAWMATLHQIVRLFVLNSVTVSSFKNLQGVDKTERSEGIAESGVSKSNMYCVSESILLRWLSYHHGKMLGGSGASVSNFDSDLADGMVFASLLSSHIPTLLRLRNLTFPSGREKQMQNLKAVFAAMREIGLDFSITPSDLFSPEPCQMLLFVLYLFQVLPHYIPQATVKFEAVLNKTVCKQVQLSNPTKRQLTYTLKLEGSSYFSVGQESVMLDPKCHAQVSVMFLSPFMRMSTARLTVLPKNLAGGGWVRVSPLVFALEGTIVSDSDSPVLTYSGRLYHHLEIPVEIQSPFNVASKLHCSLIQEFSPVQRLARGSKKPTASDVEASYWILGRDILLGPNEKTTITLHFLPFAIGVHQVRLQFLDERVGEFFALVSCTATLPQPTDTIKWIVEEQCSADKEIFVPLKSMYMTKARDVLRQLESPKYKRASGSMVPILPTEAITYKVEYSSPFFAGPDTFVLDPLEKDKAQAILVVSFHPKGCGSYPCNVVLSSPSDTRVFEIEAKARAKNQQFELEFEVPCRQTVTQDIPIINPTDVDWPLNASLSGDYWSGPGILHCHAKRSTNYSLVFRPLAVGTVRGTLLLSSSSGTESFYFNMKATVSEPLAEEDVSVDCIARKESPLILRVPNVAGERTKYKVETDLPYVTGLDSIEFATSNEIYEYELLIQPRCSGTFDGTVTFTAPNGQYLWYQVNINAAMAPTEDTLNIVCQIRKAVLVEISLQNPTDSDSVDFDVSISGAGLRGEPQLLVPPGQTVVYRLMYSPSVPGSSEGSVVFHHPVVGEFWYKLILEAEPSTPVVLPPLSCEVGKSQSMPVFLANPTDKDVKLNVSCSNSVNFDVDPSPVVLAANKITTVCLLFLPSTFSQEEEATIVLSAPEVGNWTYSLRGRGVLPTLMDTIRVVAAIGESKEEHLSFRNPLVEDLTCNVLLFTDNNRDANAFQLCETEDSLQIPPHSTVRIGLRFNPSCMDEYRCRLIISRKDGLKWEYPVVGIPSFTSTMRLSPLCCKSRTRHSEVYKLTLPSVGTMAGGPAAISLFYVSLVAPERQKTIVDQSVVLAIDRVEVDRPNAIVYLKAAFAPLRPFIAKCSLNIGKRNGGTWSYNLRLEATDSPVDDVLNMEAALNTTTGLAFSLPTPNVFTAVTPFRVFLTGAEEYFVVKPREGIFEKFDPQTPERGVQFQVSFRPSKRIATDGSVTANLFVETAIMQWNYELRGKHPTAQRSQTMQYIMGNRGRRSRATNASQKDR